MRERLEQKPVILRKTGSPANLVGGLLDRSGDLPAFSGVVAEHVSVYGDERSSRSSAAGKHRDCVPEEGVFCSTGLDGLTVLGIPSRMP